MKRQLRTSTGNWTVGRSDGWSVQSSDRRAVRPSLHTMGLVLVLAILLAATTANAQSKTITPEQRKAANDLIQAGQWSDAADAMRKILEVEPKNGGAWYQLGYALYSLEDYDASVEAYQRSLDVQPHPTAMYNLACSYALLGDKAHAIEWLDSAVHNGFSQPQLLRTDTDMDAIRDHARFAELVAVAESKAYPCTTAPEYRQLDFWVGSWRVYNQQGTQVGTNKVERILGQCVIQENWSGAGGMDGKSYNIYDAASGRWHQTWVSNKGALLQFDGQLVDGAMRFEGTSSAPDGSTIHNRMTLTPVSENEVRQVWEQSPDGGTNWAVVFDGKYVRE